MLPGVAGVSRDSLGSQVRATIEPRVMLSDACAIPLAQQARVLDKRLSVCYAVVQR